MPPDPTTLLACPACGHSNWRKEGAWHETVLQTESAALRCLGCQKSFAVEEGIIDFLGEHNETITPFQRIMQFGPVVAMYENYWRRLGYFVASSRSFERDLERIVQWVDPQQHGMIVDLACGPGLFARRLAPQCPGWVWGIDMSRPMLRRARTLSLKQGLLRMVYLRASAFQMPLRAACVDAVCCCGALHLFDDPARALAEVRRVLKEGHDLVCQTTLRPRFSAGMATFLDRIIRFGFFEEEQLARLLESNSFQMIASEQHRIRFMFKSRK